MLAILFDHNSSVVRICKTGSGIFPKIHLTTVCLTIDKRFCEFAQLYCSCSQAQMSTLRVCLTVNNVIICCIQDLPLTQ